MRGKNLCAMFLREPGNTLKVEFFIIVLRINCLKQIDSKRNSVIYDKKEGFVGVNI